MRQVYARTAIAQLFAIFLFSFVAQAQTNDTTTVEKIDARGGLLRQPTSMPILFGEQDKSKLLQSVATAYTGQLITTPANSFLQALPGRLTGLNIGFTSGGPGLDGSGLSYNIRGARAQIILVDGVERNYLNLDAEQIESVSVLKDALSTVMFGQRSSYGILSIRTKKGDVGRPRISFTAQSGIESPTALPKPLPAWQYATLYNEAKQNDARIGEQLAPAYSPGLIDTLRNGLAPFQYPNVDWYNTVLNKQAAITRYNLNLQGSGKGFRYFVDLDKLTEKGLFKTLDSNNYNTNSQLDRYILRTNLGIDVTPTTFVQVNLFGRLQRYNQPGAGVGTVLSSLLNTPQLAYPVFNPNGTFGGTSSYAQNANVYGQAVARGHQFQDVRDVAVDLEVTQKLDVLANGLYLRAKASNNNTVYYTTTRTKNFESYQYTGTGYNKLGNASEQTAAGSTGERSRIVYLEGSAGYDKMFGKHSVSALAIANRQSRLIFSTTQLPENYDALAGKLNYSYNDKYILEGAISRGGYNRLTPAKRWATYWATGIGWNLHKESVIKNNLRFISNLKLRGNYGTTGQVNAGYYSYIQTYYTNLNNADNAVGYWYGPGSSLERSSGESIGTAALANPILGPEKAKKLDAGIDLGLWKNKLTITADYFYNKFYDLVGTPNLTTTVLGANYPLQNYQRFNYWGTDLSATWQDKLKGFSYFITANFSLVQSKVVYNQELARQYDYQVTTGRPVSLLYGLTALGLFKSYDEINDPATASLVAKSTLRPGDIRYLDRNGDGIIDANDQGPIGNGKAAIYYGTTLGFNIKGFDVSALVQGTINRQTYLSGDFWNGFGNSGLYNAYEYNLGRFTEASAATATQPRLWLGNNTNNQTPLLSSFWLRETDFVRLKNLEIGYSLPEKISRKIGLPIVRLFANGLNLLTWSELYKIRKDLDPESVGAAYPIMKVYNFGINVKF